MNCEYDTADRLTRVAWRDALGQPLLTFADATAAATLRRDYDDFFRVANLSLHAPGDDAGDPLWSCAYAYDADGDLIQAGDLAFTRDPATGFPVSAALGALTDAWAYNGFGEVTGRVVSYDRDALQRVTARRVNGALDKGWIYKDGLAPIAETDARGVIVACFAYGADPFAPDYMTRAGATYRFIRDFQGSVRLVVDAATGAVAQRLDYDAFGNVLADTNPGFQPFGVQAGLYDPDLGLVHFGARWYDPSTGRWLSPDPIGISGGLNQYVFCGNNPVNFADPFGLCDDGSKWDQMEWWEKLGEGYYYGTGYGEDALQSYVDITLDPNSHWYQKGPAYIGGFFAALWTPETYQETGWTIVSAYGMRNAGNLTADGRSGTRRFQVRNRTTGEPYVRVDKGPVPGKQGPRTHYHRRPDLKKHRPYEGL